MSHHNKGVHTVIDSDTSESTKVELPRKSISAVKKDLETVINLMGPETPHYIQTSSDVENEETFSVISKVDKKDFSELNDDSFKTTCTETLPRDEKNSIGVEPATSCTNCSIVSVQYHPAKKNSDVCRCIYSDCNEKMCPRPLRPLQTVSYCQHNPRQSANRNTNRKLSANSRNVKPKKTGVYGWVRNVMKKNKNEQHEESLGSDYYKINVRRSTMDHLPPKKLVFELVDSMKKKKFKEPVIVQCTNPDCISVTQNKSKDMKNFSNEKMVLQEVNFRNPDTPKIIDEPPNNNEELRKATIFDFDASTRVDVYYFDHGDVKYLQTVDRSPLATTEMVAERTEEYTTKFWAEIFGTIHIGFSFCTAFMLQLCRFLTVSIVRPMTVGVLQVVSDYFFKPLLATIFNSVIQPPLIFLYNVTTSIRDLSHPLAESMGYFLREIAELFRAFRFVEVKNNQPVNA